MSWLPEMRNIFPKKGIVLTPRYIKKTNTVQNNWTQPFPNKTAQARDSSLQGSSIQVFLLCCPLQCRCLWILKKKMNRFLPPSLLLCSPLLRWDGASPSFWGVPVWLSGGGQLKLLVAEKSDVENASFFYQWPLCGFPLPTGNIMTWM